MNRYRITTLILAGVISLAMLTTGGPGAQGAPSLRPLQIGIGTLSFSTMQQALRYYDEQNKIINEIGRQFGYDIDVRWFEFPVAPEEFAAFEAGTIVIGPMATFPLIGQLKRGQKWRILTNSLGMFPFMLMVRKDGAIKKIEDLPGKRIGLALGTAHQFVFESFLLATFGKTSAELGITLVSQPVPVPVMPRGLDAYQTFVPAILPALENPNSDIVPLLQLTAPPQTGPGYDGPLGRGAGHKLPSADKSSWKPEGFIALRNLFVVTDAFLQSHPDAVKAFVIAHQTVIRRLRSFSPERIADIFAEPHWNVMPKAAYARAIGNDLLYKHRDWVWPTEEIIKVLLGESQAMVRLKILPEPLSLAEVRAAFDPTTKILREAYQATGRYPSRIVFTNPNAEDLRGVPTWEVDWKKWENFKLE